MSLRNYLNTSWVNSSHKNTFQNVRCTESKAPRFYWPVTKLGITHLGRNKFEVTAFIEEFVKISDSIITSGPQNGVGHDVCTNSILWQNYLLPRENQWQTFTNIVAMFMKCCGTRKHGWSPGEKSGGFWDMKKHSCMVRLAEAVLSQPLLPQCCSVTMPSFVRIDASQLDNWRSVFQSANEVLTLRTLRPIYRTGVKLPSRCPILYIYSTNIRTEYFKHAV